MDIRERILTKLDEISDGLAGRYKAISLKDMSVDQLFTAYNLAVAAHNEGIDDEKDQAKPMKTKFASKPDGIRKINSIIQHWAEDPEFTVDSKGKVSLSPVD